MNRPDIYLPALRACAEQFQQSPQAVGCHWDIAFSKYLTRQNDAADWMRAHVERYPQSDKATSAMYFLGRMAENAGSYSEARGWYNGITDRFPNYYYTIQSRERLLIPAVAQAAPAPAVQEFLRKLNFRQSQKLSFEPTASTKKRLERAKLLRSAGMDDWADSELRFAARNDGQAHLVAMELTQQAQKQCSTDQGIRSSKVL